MSGFKFDNNDEKKPLSLGDGDGATPQKPAAPKLPAAKKPSTSLPAPSIPTKPVMPGVKPATSNPLPSTNKPAIPSVKPVTPPVKPATPTATPQPLKLPEEAPVATPAPVVSQPAVTETVAQPTIPKIAEPVIEDIPIISVPDASPRIPIVVTSEEAANDKRPRKPANKFKGNRKVVLYARIGIGVVAGIILIAGVKTVFFPTKFPTPEQVIAVVKTDLNVTKFPVTQATGFVTDFTNTYFSYDPTNTSARDEALKKYISSNLLNSTNMNFVSTGGGERVTQTVVGTPLIVKTVSVDDNNAVFTMQVILSTGTTLYVDVPIYYNPDINGMAVSAPLSIMPSVGTAKVPADNHSIAWNEDKQVEDTLKPDLEKYLQAWAASDETSISRYINKDSNLNTKLGLSGSVQFNRLDTLKVQAAATDGSSDPKIRQAYASVIWQDSNNKSMTYNQAYLLTIKQDGGRWYINNIESTIVK